MPSFSGQGKVFVAPVAAGVAGAFQYLGDCSRVEVQLETEVEEYLEHTSGDRLTRERLQRAKRARITIAAEEWSADNIALMLYGAKATIAASTVTNEAGPNPLAVGDYWRTAKHRISSVVVKDSAGSPATLVLNTHYTIESADHGMIKMGPGSLAGYTQPFKADYSYAAVVNVPMFSVAAPERWFRFHGLNTADGKKPVLIEMYRAVLDPIASLPMINDTILSAELSGSALYDETKTGNSELGNFGRIALLY